jgi:chromate transporter
MSTAALSTYFQLIGLFGMLSLLSIGGGNVVLPEMHINAVNGRHWLTNSQFADLFSISQTAPGPSILIVSMVGYGAGLKVAGIPGALIGGIVSMVAMVVPAAGFVYVITLIWQKAVGLILAASLVMSRAADHDWRAYTVTAVCTVIFMRTKLNPLIVVAAAGLAGYLGFI